MPYSRVQIDCKLTFEAHLLKSISIMAPHSLDDIMDFPSHAPSATNYTKLQSSLKNHHHAAKNATESFAGTGVQRPIWQLDAEELLEIEQPVGSFKGGNHHHLYALPHG